MTNPLQLATASPVGTPWKHRQLGRAHRHHPRRADDRIEPRQPRHRLGLHRFTVGSLAWLALGIATGQSSLLWQNVVLTVLNLFGIWRWLGREAQIEDGGKTAARTRARATPGETLFPVIAADPRRDRRPRRGQARHAGRCDGRVPQRPHPLSRGRHGGVGGVGERLHRLEWDKVAIEGDTARADLDGAALARLPELTKDDWPGR